MFEVGDSIIYGNNGVCTVEKIGPLDSAKTSNSRSYYTLSPCYSSGSFIYTPVDNEKVLMRPAMTKDEAIQLIDDMESIELLEIKDEKSGEMRYKEALRKCDVREVVKVIKTIHTRKQTRLSEGKKITATDERYFNIAEERLYGELAVSLNMNKDEVRKHVIEKNKV